MLLMHESMKNYLPEWVKYALKIRLFVVGCDGIFTYEDTNDYLHF